MRNEIWEEKVKKKKWELNENEQAECHLQSSEYTASRHGHFPEQCQLKSFWKFHTQQQQQQQYRKKMLWQRALAQFHQIEFLLPYFSIHCVSRSPMMGMRAVRCLTHRQWIVINEYYILIIHDFNRCISKPTVWVLRNKKFQREIQYMLLERMSLIWDRPAYCVILIMIMPYAVEKNIAICAISLENAVWPFALNKLSL